MGLGAWLSPTDRMIQQAAMRGMKGPSARGEYQVHCPFCKARVGKEDTKRKLQLNPGKGVYFCYRCGTKGRANLAWIAGPVVEVEDKKPTALGPPEGFIPLHADDTSMALKPYYDYLRKREIFKASLTLGVGACINGRYAGRIVIPHTSVSYLEDGVRKTIWAGFAARAIFPGVEPRYLYPPGMDRKSALFGLGFPYSQRIFVVEGPIDALALFPEAVATFGKEVTPEQVGELVKLSERSTITICLDGDAWEDCQVLAVNLALHGCDNVQWCRLPPGEDPGSLGWGVLKYIQFPNT